ncbi:hypothetical protein LTR12_013867 [Friedmanniomyces endolithicus]|nr:hypothetical protein LTR12_013867 [Friedmanniomyces endolithicus]
MDESDFEPFCFEGNATKSRAIHSWIGKLCFEYQLAKTILEDAKPGAALGELELEMTRRAISFPYLARMETSRRSGGVWSSGHQASCPGDARDVYFIVVGAFVSGEDQKSRRHLGVLLLDRDGEATKATAGVESRESGSDAPCTFDASASTTPLSPTPALGADIARYTMGLSQANINENVEESHGGLTEEQAQTQCESSFDTAQVGASEAHVHPHSRPLEHGSGGSTSPSIQTRDELLTLFDALSLAPEATEWNTAAGGSVPSLFQWNFGTHAGKTLEEPPDQYIHWIVNRGFHLTRPDIRHALEDHGWNIPADDAPRLPYDPALWVAEDRLRRHFGIESAAVTVAGFQPAKVGKWRLSDIEVYKEMFGHESGMNFDQCYDRFNGGFVFRLLSTARTEKAG